MQSTEGHHLSVLIVSRSYARNRLKKQHYSPFKISSLMLELEKLKKEKTETEFARKTAEEQAESTRKDHEAKVHIFVTFTDLINGDNY